MYKATEIYDFSVCEIHAGDFKIVPFRLLNIIEDDNIRINWILINNLDLLMVVLFLEWNAYRVITKW